MSKDYEHLAQKMSEARSASSDLVKGMEADIAHISKLTSKASKIAMGGFFGVLGAAQLQAATSRRDLTELHEGTFGVQAVGKSIAYGGQQLGNIKTQSYLGGKGIEYASRGLKGAGGFLDFGSLKAYDSALQSLASTGTKTGAALAKAFGPLRLLFNPVTGAILIAADAMESFHSKAVQSREEFEQLTKTLSNFYTITKGVFICLT